MTFIFMNYFLSAWAIPSLPKCGFAESALAALRTSIQLITTFTFINYFLSAKKESSKEIRLAGAATEDNSNVRAEVSSVRPL